MSDGYCFMREKMGVNGKGVWKYYEYKDSKCMARCHTVAGAVGKRTAAHNHIAGSAKIEARKTMAVIKERAATTQECTNQIVATASAGATAAAAVQLPSVRGIKQTIRRVRREQQNTSSKSRQFAGSHHTRLIEDDCCRRKQWSRYK